MSTNNLPEQIVHRRNELLTNSLRLTKNIHDAEDLVQETILKAYKNKQKFKF